MFGLNVGMRYNNNQDKSYNALNTFKDDHLQSTNNAVPKVPYQKLSEKTITLYEALVFDLMFRKMVIGFQARTYLTDN